MRPILSLAPLLSLPRSGAHARTHMNRTVPCYQVLHHGLLPVYSQPSNPQTRATTRNWWGEARIISTCLESFDEYTTSAQQLLIMSPSLCHRRQAMLQSPPPFRSPPVTTSAPPMCTAVIIKISYPLVFATIYTESLSMYSEVALRGAAYWYTTSKG